MAVVKKSVRSKGRAREKTNAKKSGASTTRPAVTAAVVPVHTKRATKSAKDPKPAAVDADRARRAFEKLEPEYRALRSRDVLRVNADVAAAANLALRAVDRVESLFDAFTAELPRFAKCDLERLRTLAFGAWYAALQARPEEVEIAAFEKLVDEGLALREQFVVASNALAMRKLFDAKTLKDLQLGVGHRDLAGDLTTFASMYTKNRARYAGKTAIEASEVKRAAEIGSALFEIVAKRDRAASNRAVSVDTKARAWTLLVRGYDALRRVVTYVRWAEGDANEIAPSLFAVPGGGRPASRKAAEAEVAPVKPEMPAGIEARADDADVQQEPEPAATEKARDRGQRGGEPFA
jgi:hypothetical protein